LIKDFYKRKLQLATAVYWILLFYIIAALLWWALSLIRQNDTMYELRMVHLKTTVSISNNPRYEAEIGNIKGLRRRAIAKYISEGSAFLLLILVGAVFVYRSVRRQFRLQQQQQNFVMAITHELKTPLAVARLNLETLQKHNLDEARKEKLVQITLQETLRLDTLINNILISSQLEGHSYRLQKEELHFSHLITDVVQQFAARYPQREVLQQVEPHIDIVGDALLLKLLLSNLLENAHKYSPKGEKIALCFQKTGNKLVLQVKDEGPGIDISERKEIFKKFYRGGSEQTRSTKGTGLGLYLCKKIAEDHNATITIKNNEPAGSNFVTTFTV
jgi:two-component system sensor histidine kinase CiaH